MNSCGDASKSNDVCKRLTECLEQNGGHLNDVIFGKWDFYLQYVKLLNVLN